MAAETGFSADELESFTADRMDFWWRCIVAYREAVKKEQG